jgi:hypothetical protein
MRPALLSALLLALSLAFGTAYAQTEEAAPPPPEVKVSNSRLSVKARDAEFGSIMKDIGKKAGFEVRVSSSVYGKKISTRFTNVDIERGINRLLALISQKTFFIHYGADGSINKVEVFSSAPAKKRRPGASRARPRRRPPRAVRPNIPPRRSLKERIEEKPSPPFVQDPVPVPGPEPDLGPNEDPGPPDVQMKEEKPPPDFEQPEPQVNEEGEKTAPAEVPYIPPRRVPAYIPRK